MTNLYKAGEFFTFAAAPTERAPPLTAHLAFVYRSPTRYCGLPALTPGVGRGRAEADGHGRGDSASSIPKDLTLAGGIHHEAHQDILRI